MSQDEAKLLATVYARAQTLFEDGYRARWTSDDLVEVTTQAKTVYELDTQNQRCPCPFFVAYGGRYSCKHLRGYLLLLMRIQQQRLQRLVGRGRCCAGMLVIAR